MTAKFFFLKKKEDSIELLQLVLIFFGIKQLNQ